MVLSVLWDEVAAELSWVVDCSSPVCYLLYVSLSRVLSPGEEAIISFESLNFQIKHELNSHSATVTGMDYSAKLLPALETDLL